MLQPELKLRRDKIRWLMAQQGIDAALITCNVNLLYTYGRVVSGYLYLPLNAPARLFVKRPNNISGEHIFSVRKPEQIIDILKEEKLPMPTKLMLEGDELPYTEYVRLAAMFPDIEVVNGTPAYPPGTEYKDSHRNRIVPSFGNCTCQSIRSDSFCLSSGND